MQKILVDKAALDALLKSATPFHDGSTSTIANELGLEALVPEAIAAARARRRAKAGESHIDPLDQLTSVVIGVPESMNRYIKAQVEAANTNVQAYTRAVLHLAMRAGLMDRVTAAMLTERSEP
ncbi:hypothetical protein E2P84_36595 [Burkholderia cepacia]|uniref:Uncharacterized protein n=1 Tax=Burkholderia cepacia TaxID=292 RepID=A0AAX2RR27_BURCE|nr:hypothetical protein [Burkholderia cepacia]TES65650.1 hypothetical protein E2P84_36595 [Burkholderia cepacia]TET01694.1 hypothetical protein E3D36_16800 [Burkholderia cepacia]TEU47552.1 hypothetical protein E3D37_16230 [Burkholderia cepacia]TEU53579.1 hypothetical protein E3D38_12620 [Burkholderia cepacia]TEV02185.1 hypothetical protein E3D40_13550 [Burkholderia cepacia]